VASEMKPTAQAAAQPQAQTVNAEVSLLDQIVGELGTNEDERKESRAWLDAFVDEVAADQIQVSKSSAAMLASRIAQIDELLSAQLNQILHSSDFQRLESTWRGLDYLVQQTETSTSLKIKVINTTKRDILNDLKSAVEFDQSTLFKKIYEEEFGQLGGSPFGLLVGDFEFGRSNEDMLILERVSNIAASAHAPFLSAAGADMFGWKDFTDLNKPRDLAKIFESDHYVRWRSFRQSDDSRYVGLTLPHILLREPYGKEGVSIEAFNYEEDVDGKDHSKYLWGNAAYSLAARMTDAFAKHEWCAAIRGVEGGGLVEGLPVHKFQTDQGDVAIKCPTEVAIPDRRENEFAKLGFIPLLHEKGTDRAAFLSVQSCQKPGNYKDPAAMANANLSSQLQYMMAVSRFAHFLKVMMRDKIGSFMSRDNCQKFLNDWISQYVLLDDNASADAKAKFPLREAQVEVTEVAGKPGTYAAVAFLRPHYQLDALTVSLRLVASLPKSIGKG
jgi:type VI secretion system protein ImpC